MSTPLQPSAAASNGRRQRALVAVRTKRGGFDLRARLSSELEERDVARICDYLTGSYRGKRHLSESRAVIIPSESGLRYDGIKIKGCGFDGGTVVIDEFHAQEYSLPHYDWEGCHQADGARAFERAPKGGMSWQQARNELEVTEYLTERGFDTYGALGYGRLERDGQRSWFCVLNAPFAPYWRWARPDYDEHLVPEIPRAQARFQKRLRELGIDLTLFGMANVEGRLARKDFHTARFAGRNDSTMTRLMYALFDVNFTLYTFAHPYFETEREGWVERAWTEYIGELVGEAFPLQAIQRLKHLLPRLVRDASMPTPERLRHLMGDPIGRLLVRDFLDADEIEWLFTAGTEVQTEEEPPLAAALSPRTASPVRREGALTSRLRRVARRWRARLSL